jgi:hypothetical protein
VRAGLRVERGEQEAVLRRRDDPGLVDAVEVDGGAARVSG